MTLTARYGFKEHQEIWLLLPWLANGRLPGPVRQRALHHTQLCCLCSQELELQQQLCAALALPERISYAPGSSLGKLMRRIDAVQWDYAACPHVRLHSPAAQRAARLWRPSGLAWAASCLLALGLAGGLAHHELAPAYQVRTDSPAPAGAVLHIIFDRTLTIGQVESLLRSAGAQLVEGPAGSAGVFGVRPVSAGKDAAQQLQQLAAGLRSDPRVRWVEPLAPAPESVASSTSANP